MLSRWCQLQSALSAESMTAAAGHTPADDQRDAHKRAHMNSTNARKHAKCAAKRAEARAIKEREERVEEATRQAIEASMAEQSTREEEEMHAALAEVEAAKREAQALGYEVVTSVMRAVGGGVAGARRRGQQRRGAAWAGPVAWRPT